MGQNPADERRRALGEIRSSVAVYRIAVILLILTAVADGAYTVETGVVTSGYFGGISGGSTTTGLSGAALGVVALAGVLGFAAFIVTLIAWWKWRGGVRRLDEPLGSYGTPGAEATGARKYYGYAVWMFVLTILTSIGVAVAVTAVVLSNLNIHVNPNGTVTPPTQAQIQSSIHAAVGVIVAGLVVGALLNLLMYYFATTSLVRAARPGASSAVQTQLAGGQRLVVVGAVVSFVTLAGLVTSYAAFAGALAPVLYLVGYTWIIQAYDAVIASPTPPVTGPPPSTPT